MTEAAREYGTALWELCSAEGIAEEVLQQLNSLQELIVAQPDWVRVLACPTIPAGQRRAAASQVLEGWAHPYLNNFVRLLIDAGRGEELPGCIEVFRGAYDEANGILPVTVVTAVPLTEQQQERLTQKLQQVTGKQIRLQKRVDKACMGGVRLEMAGGCLDGSVKAQLEALRSRLLAAN